jgi:hypothetical protein
MTDPGRAALSWTWHWRQQIFYMHFTDHPDYNRYIGGADQEAFSRNLVFNP